eukprot:9095441-Alexandrium_andersonii.AAC.1
MVCKADLGKGRQVDCWSATAISTTATGSSTTTAESTPAASSRNIRSADVWGTSTTSGGGPMGHGVDRKPRAGSSVP